MNWSGRQPSIDLEGSPIAACGHRTWYPAVHLSDFWIVRCDLRLRYLHQSVVCV